MRMDGYFNERDEPVIGLDVGTLLIEMLVDTGFNGSLIIPTPLAHGLDLDLDSGFEEFHSVTGEMFLASSCFVEVDWLGQRSWVSVAICSEVNEAILGNEMLKNCCLTIDYGRRIVNIRESY
jgi:clan AA aspartic protease